MRILVTGGAGFIGSHLVDGLIQKGHQVSVVDNLSTGEKENLNPEARFYEIDIRSSELLEVFEKEKPEVVFHLASQINLRKSIEDPVFDTEVNILGSLNVLECCRKYRIRKIIFSSTGGAIYPAPVQPQHLAMPRVMVAKRCGTSGRPVSGERGDEGKKRDEGDGKGMKGREGNKREEKGEEFGDSPHSGIVPIPTPETAAGQPTSPYGLAKLTVEKYLEIYRQIYGLDYVALRYANVYGPRQNTKAEAGVIAIFIENLLKGKPCIINGDGRQTRDYVYIDDVVRANIMALEIGSNWEEKEIRGRKGMKGSKGDEERRDDKGREGMRGMRRDDKGLGIGSGTVPVYNVGTGVETDVNEIFGKIMEIINLGREGIKREDKGKNGDSGRLDLVKYGPAIKGELQRSALDWQKINKELGWGPKVDLDKGLKLTIDWFRNIR